MPVNVVFLTILLFCLLYTPPGISSNTDSDYDEIRILGLCDSDLHADCVTAFTQVLSDNDEMATHAIYLNWSVIQTSKDLVTGLREMDGVCSKYPYDIMVAFGETPTMMTAMFTADAFNITLLAYDTTPGHVLNLEGSYMVQLNRSPYYSGEAMVSLISRFGYSWVNVICQDRFLDDGFLSRFYEESAAYGIMTGLNGTVSRSDNWTVLQHKLKRFQRSAFKIIVIHCEVFVMRRVVQIGRVLNLFSNNYVWFLTEFATEHSRKADYSLPVGLIGLERTEPDGYAARVSSTLRTLLKHLQSDPVLDWGSSDISLTDYANYTLIYNYTLEPWVRDLKLSLESPLEMDLPIGYGFTPPRTNYSFQVLNLVTDFDGTKIWKEVGSLDNLYVNLSTMVELPGKRHNSTHRTRKLYRVITKISPPFIMEKEAFTESGECYSYAPCVQLQSGNDSDLSSAFEDYLLTNRYNTKKYDVSCCTGVTIDILVKLATDMEFDFILFFLKEPPSGGGDDSGGGDANQTTFDSEIWNDTLQYLEDDLADIVAGPLSITVERMKYITYTEVYFYTGFSMITMKKERETSMDAFLKPFSVEVWLGIVISATVTAVATSLFEWNSPFGLNPKGRKRERNYTLGSALTMVYSVLFGHIVRTKSPKSWPGKVLQNFWAGLAIFIIASYTANLAAYLAGRSEQSDLLSINDKRLYSMRVAVIENGAANYFLSKINPRLFDSQLFLRSTEEALRKLKSNEIEVFIHDTYLLKYAVARLDENCTITFAGDSFGEDGYAFGLKKGSKLMDPLSDKILAYTSSGYIEELTKKYFLRKGCDPQWGHLLEIKYGPQHTAGLFVLLIVAITLSVLLMVGEYVLFKYLIPFLRKKPACSRWRSINIMFLSQRFFRILNSDQLVSPQSAAREIMHIVRNRDFAKFFQKDEIKITRALRRNPPPPRAPNIYDLATTMIRTQRQEEAAAKACDTQDTTTDEEQGPLDISDISPQYSSQIEYDSGCGTPCGGATGPSKSVTNISAPDLRGQMVSYSLISGFSDNSKSKDSFINEEDILLNTIQMGRVSKSGIENPAFTSKDSEETSLSTCISTGGCSRVSAVDGDKEGDDIEFGMIEEKNGDCGGDAGDIPLYILDSNSGSVVVGGHVCTGDANCEGGSGARVKVDASRTRSASSSSISRRRRRRHDPIDDVNIDMESNVDDDVIGGTVAVQLPVRKVSHHHHSRHLRRSSAPQCQHHRHRYIIGGGSMNNINVKHFYNGDGDEDDDNEDKNIFTATGAGARRVTSSTFCRDYEDGEDEYWDLRKWSSTNSSHSSMLAGSNSAKNNTIGNASDSSPGGDGVSCCGSKDNATALRGVTPSEYYKRSLRMKDNRVKSTIRRHALRGVRPLLPATMIDECTIEALSKEDLLVMWKSSEIELQKRLGEVLIQKEKLKRLIANHMQNTDV